jgi:hypothetical protein
LLSVCFYVASCAQLGHSRTDGGTRLGVVVGEHVCGHVPLGRQRQQHDQQPASPEAERRVAGDGVRHDYVLLDVMAAMNDDAAHGRSHGGCSRRCLHFQHKRDGCKLRQR